MAAPNQRTAFAAALMVSLGLGGQINTLSAQEDPAQPHRKGILFEDRFERSELGMQYEVVNPDPNRFALTGNKLLLVASKPVKNFVLLNKNLPGDFVTTVQVTMQVAAGNFTALYYYIDEKNFLSTGITAADNCHAVPWGKIDCSWSNRRQPFFSKVVGGETNNIAMRIPSLASRSLDGYAEKEEPWYFQLRREGIKYTAQISVDGVRWTDLGTHVVIPKHGRLGIKAGSRGGVENAAEFGELVVQE